MVAGEHLREPDLVTVTFPHLPPIQRDHIVMQPVTGRDMLVADRALCNLTLMMRKLQVHTSTVYVKLRPEIFGSHGGTFDMPSGESLPPGAHPAHNMFLRRILPQRNILPVPFL